jgi:7-carboxy-7-deazaguanine synthase
VSETTTTRDWLLVSETFYTLQGEGPSSGQPAFFVRLGACNLHCRWCDTPYTWAFSEKLAADHDGAKRYDPQAELTRRTIIDIAADIFQSQCGLCVITGGEPMLQMIEVHQLIRAVSESIYTPRFEIETAGTIAPNHDYPYELVHYNVSPKLATSGNAKLARYKPDVLAQYRDIGSTFKFVVDTRQTSRSINEDIIEIEQIVRELEIPRHNIWLMPCATTLAQLIVGKQVLADVCKERRWNLSSRLQIDIWGDKRGT